MLKQRMTWKKKENVHNVEGVYHDAERTTNKKKQKDSIEKCKNSQLLFLSLLYTVYIDIYSLLSAVKMSSFFKYNPNYILK